jgi:hypothetical protein
MADPFDENELSLSAQARVAVPDGFATIYR